MWPTTKVIVLTLLINSISCQTILTPKQVFVGEVTELLLISGVDAEASLVLSSSGKFSDTIFEDTVHFHKDKVERWNFVLNDSFVGLTEVHLRAHFGNPKKRVVTQTMRVQSKRGYAILQTDKPIYRVTETVRMRAFQLDRSLMPIKEPMKLRIINHQKIIVEEEKFTPSNGSWNVFEFNYRFPSIAKPGIWMAQLFYGPNLMLMTETPLEITEYVLPLFEIKVNTPKYVLVQKNLKVKISTTVFYTFGKPVNGTIYYRFSLKDGYKGYLPMSTDTFCVVNGHHSYQLNMQPFFDTMSDSKAVYRLYIEAVVSDHTTGRKDRVFNDQMIITDEKYRIVVKESLLQYKPNIPAYISFQLLDPVNEKITNVHTKIELKDAATENKLSLFKTFSQGNNTYTYKLNKNVGPLKGVIEVYDNHFPAFLQFEVKPYDASEKTFLSIVNRSETAFRAGDTYRTSIVFTGPVRKDAVFAVIISKEKIIDITQLPSVDDKTQLTLELTNKMVPNVQVLVVGFTSQPDVYVADEVILEVEQHKCGVEIGMPSTDNVLPGSPITMTLVGKAGDIVGLQATDKSVHLLRSNTFTKKLFAKLLAQDESSCKGKAAYNFHEVLRNTGLQLMSANQNVHKMNKNVEEECKRNIRRKRNHSPGGIDLAQCCELAYLNYEVRMSCQERGDIVGNFTSQECKDKFIFCCRGKRRNISYMSSVSTSKSNSPPPQASDMHEIQSDIRLRFVEKEEYVKVRSDFRETWLFDLVLMNKSHETFVSTIPDTITSWTVSSLSISQKHGFCLNQPQDITSFKSFFIKVDFPPMIVQYEHTEVKVTVFNYATKDLKVLVNFNNTQESLCSESILAEPIRKIIESVKMNSATTIAYPLVGLKAGRFPIEVTATTLSNFRDKVVKMITVNPPGVIEESFVSFDLDPANRTRRAARTKVESSESIPLSVNIESLKDTQSINVTFKNDNVNFANIVPETTRYTITAMGERFNPKLLKLEDLSKLLKKPKGCGEQNMFYMAFNLYSLRYLDATGSFYQNNPHANPVQRTKNMNRFREKGVRYLERARANQLSFRKEDGSFSAFERRPSSVWLTAFVLKVLCQAQPYLEQKQPYQGNWSVIIDAINWIKGKQHGKPDQAVKQHFWMEITPLLHEKALGGTAGRFGLTAYVVMALNECKQVMPTEVSKSIQLEDAIHKGEETLVQSLSKINRIYTKILAIYALSYNDRYADDVKAMLTKIMKESRFDGINNFRHWDKDYPIEATAYALLLLMKTNPRAVNDHLPIVNWLSTKEVNSTFENTQDTVVALEALSKFYLAFNRNTTTGLNQVYLKSSIAFNDKWKREIKFNQQNLNVLQTIDVDEGTNKIGFVTEGNALGKVNLLMSYHVFNPNNSMCQIEMDVKICEWRTRHIRLSEDTFDGSLLFAKNVTFAREMGFNPEKKPVPIASSPDCFSALSRNKRTVPSDFNFIHNVYPVQKHTQKRRNNNRGGELQTEAQCTNVKFPPIYNLKIDQSQEIRIMNICVRHRFEVMNDMTILEVSMLSGYRPIEQDLEAIKNEHKDFIDNYENVKSKVTFYFGKVPLARTFCFSFRLLQEYKVEKLQMALVRIYNYYNTDSSCSRLYSDIRITSKSNFACDKEESGQKICKCTHNGTCPENESLKRIERDIEIDLDEAKKNFKRYLCHYQHVHTGKVTKIHDLQQQYILTIETDSNLRGDVNGNFNVTLHKNCLRGISEKDTVIILHNDIKFSFTRTVHMGHNTSLLKIKDDNSPKNGLYKLNDFLTRYYSQRTDEQIKKWCPTSQDTIH